MHDTWWRFSQKLKMCLNHVCGGSFMKNLFLEIMQIIDGVSKNNRAWHTRDVEVGDLGFTFKLSAQ
ncbi:hypothetical protein KY285_020270 [Solanum tuberosum]|nr:hypothetical protein KY289_020510 [Solanum tuberosum]KAH0693173.1 hypothetical protein KY285_020270 [Solanum tuberosum]